MSKEIVVIPCYNEAERLDFDEFARFSSFPDIELLFVNDGSTDHTLNELQSFAKTMDSVSVHSLDKNSGKAEAVRQGLLRGIESGAGYVGFMDADLATPVDEGMRLLYLLRNNTSFQAIIAARVGLSGRHTDRDMRRHYAGRVFSTLASLVLKSVIYDTQCGAKFFRCNDALSSALDEPFLSRWAFDVELLGRLIAGSATTPGIPSGLLVEEPLYVWTDVAGSKFGLRDMVQTTMELYAIHRDLDKRRRLAQKSSSNHG
jgi:glycosyltransferase involved in cell wall biosynthesis